MKIKKLRLKNIASIETADIDFEKGLADGLTGEPASIFLISGDTGAGKSVILDGIAMALYKKTPRITSVANIVKNEFKSPNGDTINVSNISQYTRIGISEKDECYSEVLFEGNDSLDYRARLTLGYLRGNTDKRTGLRPLKYRNPEWSLTLPNGTVLDKSSDVETAINKVVGLDFDQFERMAMLAQGQFEAFLTGKKEERMVVLEKLTNTEHFKTYGEAIENRFKRAKSDYALVEAKQKEAMLNPLATIDIQQLNDEISRLEEEKTALSQAITKNRETFEHVKAIEQGEQTQAATELVRQRLMAIQDSIEFKQRTTLVHDWDATNIERQQLSQLQQATAKKLDDEHQLAQLKAKFDQLSSDLEKQMQRIANQEDELFRQSLWLEERKDREQLYTKHGEWQLKMNYLGQLRNKQNELAAKITATQGLTGELQRKVKEASLGFGKACDAVHEKQKAIDALTQKRQALNPSLINERLNQALSQKATLERLQEALLQLAEKQASAKTAQDEIAAEETHWEKLKTGKEHLEGEYNKAKASDDAAQRRLTTMKMSLNDTIIALRKRLISEQTETCPLCGQHISQMHLSQDFQNVISPLETEQKETAKALRLAEEQYHNANDNLLRTLGELNTKKRNLQQQESQINVDKRKTEETARQAGLDPNQDYYNQIAALLDNIEHELTHLKSDQREAESLQGEINAQLADKKPLDERKSQAEGILNEARNSVEHHTKELEIARNHFTEVKTDIEALEAELTETLSPFYPDWQIHPDATGTLLNQEATTYLERKAKQEKAKSEIESIKTKIKTIRDTRSALLELQPQWDTPVHAADYPFHDRIRLWTDLLTRVSAYAKSLVDDEQTIRDNQSKLNDYYARTGKTQAELESLMAQTQQIESTRKSLNDHAAELKSCQNAIEQAQRQIEDAMAKIGTTQKDGIPQRDAIESERRTLDEKFQNCVGSLAQNSKQLLDYKSFKKHLEDFIF